MKTGMGWNWAWFALAGVMAALSDPAVTPAAAQGVATVSDLSGKGLAQALTITAEIPVDARLQVDEGAGLALNAGCQRCCGR